MLHASYPLRHMQMAQSQIIDARREDGRRDMRQRAHIEVTHAIAINGLASGSEQMAHTEQGDVRCQAVPQRRRLFQNLRVVPADGFLHLAFLVAAALPFFHQTHVGIAQEGNGTDDERDLALGIAQDFDLFRWIFGQVAYHMDIQHLQDLARSPQHGGRIMVACSDDHMSAGGKIDLPQKIIIQALGPVAGRAAIEDVPGNDQDIHFFFLQSTGKPVQESRKFLVAFLAEKRAAKMPVRCMKYAHEMKAGLMPDTAVEKK